MTSCETSWKPNNVLPIGSVFERSTERRMGGKHRLDNAVDDGLHGSSIPPTRFVGPVRQKRTFHAERSRFPPHCSRVDASVILNNDLWIAALALEHDLTLITRDRHFERIAQLPREE